MAGLSRKIILSGNKHAGKTSLVNQYVHRRFLHEYPSTIGVRIDHAQVMSGGAAIELIIWDLASERSQEDVPQAYLIKAEGIIYVVDISEPISFAGMAEDLGFLRLKLPGVPMLIVANKSDKVASAALPGILESMPVSPDIITSARDGVNVNLVFERIAEMMK